MESNEEAILAALATIGIHPAPPVTAQMVDDGFRDDRYKKRKGEFALEVAGEFAKRHADGQPVHVPAHIQELFDFLYSVPGDAEPAEDRAPEHADAADVDPPF